MPERATRTRRNRYQAISRRSRRRCACNGDVADTGQFQAARGAAAAGCRRPLHRRRRSPKSRARTQRPWPARPRPRGAPPCARSRPAVVVDAARTAPATSCASPFRRTGTRFNTGEGGVTYAPRAATWNRTAAAPSRMASSSCGAGGSGNLPARHHQLLQNYARSNPNLRSRRSRRDSLGGRSGLTTVLANTSDVSGRPSS